MSTLISSYFVVFYKVYFSGQFSILCDFIAKKEPLAIDIFEFIDIVFPKIAEKYEDFPQEFWEVFKQNIERLLLLDCAKVEQFVLKHYKMKLQDLIEESKHLPKVVLSIIEHNRACFKLNTAVLSLEIELLHKFDPEQVHN